MCKDFYLATSYKILKTGPSFHVGNLDWRWYSGSTVLARVAASSVSCSVILSLDFVPRGLKVVASPWALCPHSRQEKGLARFLYLLLHLVCFNTTCQVGSGKLHCIHVRM